MVPQDNELNAILSSMQIKISPSNISTVAILYQSGSIHLLNIESMRDKKIKQNSKSNNSNVMKQDDDNWITFFSQVLLINFHFF